jgi:hypothetical protein
MAPVSLYIDGINRYIPDATRLIHFDLSFSDPPLYPLLLALPAAVLGGSSLYAIFKLLSLVLWAVVFWQSNRLLGVLKVPPRQAVAVLALFSLLSWPLLLSVSVLPDMLFLALFLAVVNRVAVRRAGRRAAAITVLLMLLLIATKPMGLIVAPSVLGFVFVRTRNWRTTAATGAMYGIAFLGFLPWLIKNKISQGAYLGTTVGPQEIASAVSPLGLSQVPHQTERAFAYFWEFPAYEKISALHVSGRTLTWLKDAYYAANLLVFALLGLAIVYGLFRGVRRGHPGYLQLVTLSASCLLFSVIYWPFFAKYDYWDTGRYAFPVLLLLLPGVVALAFELTRKSRVAVAAVACLAATFSLVNSGVIVVQYGQLERHLDRMIAVTATSVLTTRVTNDIYTQTYWQFVSGHSVRLDPNLSAVACVDPRVVDDFRICFDAGSGQIQVVKTSGTSRVTT